MKRILSLALVLVMLLSQFSLTAMANGETMNSTAPAEEPQGDLEELAIGDSEEPVDEESVDAPKS